LMPLEREVKLCTDPKEATFKDFMKKFSASIAGYLQQLATQVAEIETEIEFFGDNDFLGSPPYPNVESFARAWDQIKIDHPGKAIRAARNAQCYAFLINISQFLVDLQNTRVFNEARRKKQERDIERQIKKGEPSINKAKNSPVVSHNNRGAKRDGVAATGSTGQKSDLIAGITKTVAPSTLREMRRQRERAMAVSLFSDEQHQPVEEEEEEQTPSRNRNMFGEMSGYYKIPPKTPGNTTDGPKQKLEKSTDEVLANRDQIVKEIFKERKRDETRGTFMAMLGTENNLSVMRNIRGSSSTEELKSGGNASNSPSTASIESSGLSSAESQSTEDVGSPDNKKGMSRSSSAKEIKTYYDRYNALREKLQRRKEKEKAKKK